MKFEQKWLSGFRGGRLKMFTDGRKDGRTTDEVITIAHPEQSSGELIKYTNISKNSVTVWIDVWYSAMSDHMATLAGLGRCIS